MPKGLIVADFFVPALVPSTELCLEDIVANRKGKRKRGGPKEGARWLHNPCRLGGPHRFRAGEDSEVAHKWARWLHNPCHLGGPHRFGAGGRIRGGPQVGKVAT